MANTGNIIVTEKDINPFSPTYNQERTRTYADFERCVPSSGDFMARTIAADGTVTVIECKEGDTHLDRYEVTDRTCVSAVIGNCTTKTVAMNWPYSTSSLVGTFQNCTNLEAVSIADTVTEIGDQTFMGCSKLNNVPIPDSVTKIGNAAFRGCDSMTSLYVPDSVTQIGSNAFLACSNLSEIRLSDNLLSIGQYAFTGTPKLTSITLPASLTNIYSYAFNGNTTSTLHTLTCLATKPPKLADKALGSIPNDFVIFVPSEAVDTYKSASEWNNYASRIQPIQS